MTFQLCKDTHMEINLQVDITEPVINVPYRELIGSLNYLAIKQGQTYVLPHPFWEDF